MYILKEQRYSKSETIIKLRKERPMRKKVYAAWILAIIMVMSGVLCTQQRQCLRERHMEAK